MTTILARDGVMIADRRTSFSRSFNSYRTNSKESKRLALDDTDKILKLRPTLKTYKDFRKQGISHEAVAAAGAGNVENTSCFYTIASISTIRDMTSVKAAFTNVFPVKESPGGFLFLNTDGTVERFTYGAKGEDNRTRFSSTKRYDKAKLVGVGTGWAGVKNILNLVGDKLTLVECFLFATYMDKHSSCDYTMYDSNKRIFYKAIQPKNSEIKKVVQKVQSLLDFYTGPKVRLRKPDLTDI